MENNFNNFLNAESLSLSFDDDSKNKIKILDGLTLKLAPGSGLLIRGPSGSGKSSLVYLLSGLLRPNKGEINWEGINIWNLSENDRDVWRKRTLGIIFQDFHLLNELSPLENVLLPASFSHWNIPSHLNSRAKLLLDEFQIPLNRKNVSDLSRGEKQRIAIARALLFDPPVLIADEPTASLDKSTGENIASLLTMNEHKDRKIIIIVSHDNIFQNKLDHQLTLYRDNTIEIIN